MTTVFETEKTAIWLKADPEGTERRLGIDKKKGYASCCWWKDRTEAAHGFLTVSALHILNRTIAVMLTKVHVEVRHGDSFRV